MARDALRDLVSAPAGRLAVLQGNRAFALGCARAGLHLADGYPGTPSTEVIHGGLDQLQDTLTVGWSVNEAVAVALGFGASQAGADVVVTMKVPGLFQAGDAVASAAFFTAERGALVLYVASDFVPSSTQYVADPRPFLRSCLLPVVEPRSHQEMYACPADAVALSRRWRCPVVVLASGILCHSEGLVRLAERKQQPPLERAGGFERFMNLPVIARRNYDEALNARWGGLSAAAEQHPLNRIDWGARRLGVISHGVTDLYLREIAASLPEQPAILSLGLTTPLPLGLARRFVEGVQGPVVVLGDGRRFVQEQLAAHGLLLPGQDPLDPRTEWTPEALLEHLLRARSATSVAVAEQGAVTSAPGEPEQPECEEAPPAAEAGAEPAGQPVAPKRPPNICAGCPYRAFGLAAGRLRRRGRLVASFGDIGCNTLLHFLGALDTCLCMGASDSQRQGAVLADPELAGRTISVIGDSTECHSGLDATRNAIFRNLPGVKVVLDNQITAMTGGQVAPSTGRNLAGEPVRFDLAAALRGEGAEVVEADAYDLKGVSRALKAALKQAAAGEFVVLLLRGACVQEVPRARRRATIQVDPELCTNCKACAICPGIEHDDGGLPHATPLCSGCGAQGAVCVQRCPYGALSEPASPEAATADATRAARPKPEQPPEPPQPPAFVLDPDALPEALRLAVRGVGGQGILFFGRVLAEVALLAGYPQVVKGETHGMAQLGGPVISTFACGRSGVHSPVLAPGTADVLVALEQSEVLRGGFLDLLRPGGTVLLDGRRIVPPGLTPDAYPDAEAIQTALSDHRVLELDGLKLAHSLGDASGRSVNVIALGLLSTQAPLDRLPVELWLRALERAAPKHAAANRKAFAAGRALA